MMDDDEIKQAQNFQDAIASVIDIYLKEGIDPDTVREVLRDHASSDLELRRKELDND